MNASAPVRGKALQKIWYLIPGVVTGAVAVIGLITAPTAAAECQNAGGATICSQGDVRGSGGRGAGAGGGVYYPYPCEYDWLCVDGGVDGGVDVVVDPGPPSRPPLIDIGQPGRPGGGGGGIGPR